MSEEPKPISPLDDTSGSAAFESGKAAATKVPVEDLREALEWTAGYMAMLRVRQFAESGDHPGCYTVLTRDALHMVVDAHSDSVLWSEDHEACEVAAACMNSYFPNTEVRRGATK